MRNVVDGIPTMGFTHHIEGNEASEKTERIYMKFKDIESFADIEVGDLVRIQRGPLECSTQIVSKIIRTIGTFCPIMGWYGGPSVKFSFVDGGSAYHFQLDQEQPIQVKHWLK